MTTTTHTTATQEGATTMTTHYHAGRNMPGYMPEADVETFDTFEDAKRYTIGELDRAGDCIQSWGEEHDCDDIPCPTYGDECPWDIASTYSHTMEELNLSNGPEWGEILPTTGSPHDLGVSYWINQCADPDCLEDQEENQ